MLSELFHGGYLYLVTSLFFVLVTIFGLVLIYKIYKLLKDKFDR